MSSIARRALTRLAPLAVALLAACADAPVATAPRAVGTGADTIATRLDPNPGAPAGLAPVGIVAHALGADDIARIVSLGVRQVRYTIYWNVWVDPVSGPAYRQRARAEVAAARDAGLRLLLVVHGDPYGTQGYDRRAEAAVAFRDFMVERVKEWPGLEWQLWNEMDAGFTTLFGADDPALSQADRGRLYGEHLLMVVPAIRTADRSATIVLGAPGLEPAPFLAGVLSVPGVTGALFDAVAIHAYGPPSAARIAAWAPPVRTLLAQRKLRTPIWVTEFGLDDASQVRAWGITDPARWDAIQLQSWQEVVDANAAAGWATRLYGYALRTDDVGDTYGIFHRDGTPRAVARWLQQTYGSARKG